MIAAATVFGGTLAPLIADTLGLATLSVGPPYFNPDFPAADAAAAALLPVGMHANWKRGRLEQKQRRILATLAVAVVLAPPWHLGVFARGGILTLVGLTLGLDHPLLARSIRSTGCGASLSLSRAVLGMTIAHIGMGVLCHRHYRRGVLHQRA